MLLSHQHFTLTLDESNTGLLGISLAISESVRISFSDHLSCTCKIVTFHCSFISVQIHIILLFKHTESCTCLKILYKSILKDMDRLY